MECFKEDCMGQECSFGYEGPPELKPRIERALRWVVHPLFGINVLDAGLVHRVVADDRCVRVSVAVTSPGCPLNDVLVEDLEAELFDHLGGTREVSVQLQREPAWTPMHMKVVPLDRLKSCLCHGRRELTGVKVHGRPAA